MSRKNLILFLGLLSLAGCSDMNYTSDVRLVFEGRIENREGAPLPNIPIDIRAQRNRGEDTNFYGDLISYGRTDDQGNYRLIIPAPENEFDYMSVRANIDNMGANNSTYQMRGVFTIMRKDFQDYTFRTNPLTLYRNSEITRLEIQGHPSGGKYLQQVYVTGEITDHLVLHPQNLLDYAPDDFTFSVARNQILDLHYTVIDTDANTQTTMQQQIVIGNDATQLYNLTY